MVMDRNGRGHRAKGLPQGYAGTYEPTADAAGNDVMPPDASGLDPKRYGHKRDVRLMNWRLEHDPTSLWLQDRLKAVRPGVDRDGNPYDYRDEPVLDPADEARMIDDAVYREDADGRPHYGRIMRALASWYPNEAERFDMARRIAENRCDALRRNVIGDPTRCYSARLVGYALTRPVRMEAILARPPYNLSAHRMRVGKRYMDRIGAYAREHGGRLPDKRQRDRIWDENMGDFIHEKIARGVQYGRGMYYSDGSNARPEYHGRPPRLDADGKPFNAREDFERMLAAGRAELDRTPGEFDDVVNRMDAHDAFASGGADAHAAWAEARRRGLDVRLIEDALGVDASDAAAWEAEYQALSSGAR